MPLKSSRRSQSIGSTPAAFQANRRLKEERFLRIDCRIRRRTMTLPLPRLPLSTFARKTANPRKCIQLGGARKNYHRKRDLLKFRYCYVFAFVTCRYAVYFYTRVYFY